MSNKQIKRTNPTTAIILAAGISNRFNGPNKLLHRLDGTPVIERTVERAGTCSLDAIVVVTGFQAGQINDCLSHLGVQSVDNRAYETGMASSIVCGVGSVQADHNILIWPGDLPLVTKQTVSMVLARGTKETIIVPALEGRWGHPVFFGSAFRSELLRLGGDGGARSVIENHRASVVLVEVDDPGVVLDVDTDADLRAAARILGRS